MSSIIEHEVQRQSRFTPERIALVDMWLITSIAKAIVLYTDERRVHQHRVEQRVPEAAYAATLHWYLARSGPSSTQLPDLPRPMIGAGTFISHLLRRITSTIQ